MALARIAVEELESEILVLDDGFQHRRLKRVLDIVLLDTTDPWGAGRIFPRGLLRESPRSLARADAVILTRCDQVDAAIKEDLRRQIAALAPEPSLRNRAIVLWKCCDGNSRRVALPR